MNSGAQLTLIAFITRIIIVKCRRVFENNKEAKKHGWWLLLFLDVNSKVERVSLREREANGEWKSRAKQKAFAFVFLSSRRIKEALIKGFSSDLRPRCNYFHHWEREKEWIHRKLLARWLHLPLFFNFKKKSFSSPTYIIYRKILHSLY